MEQNKQQSDWQKRDIGALWKREGKNEKYLSGYFKDALGEQVEVVIFSNKYKKDNPKAPDYRIYLSSKLDKSEPKSQTTITKVVKMEAKKVEVEEEEDLL